MKKINLKIYIFLCAIFLTEICALSQNIASSWSGGNGSENDPYKISNISQLRKLAQDVNNGNTYNGKYFILTSDIRDNNKVLNDDGSLVEDQTGLNIWKTIGELDSKFRGHFDGNNHIISGIYGGQKDGTPDNCIFGTVEGADIRNVIIKDSYFRSLVRRVYGSSTSYITNCVNYGTAYAPFLVGAITTTYITNCGNFGPCVMAGISNSSSHTIFVNCYNYGDIGDGTLGYGITEHGCIFINCVNYGNINAAKGAGICGKLIKTKEKESLINNVVNIGKIQPYPNVENWAVVRDISYSYPLGTNVPALLSNIYYLESSATQVGIEKYDDYICIVSGDNQRMTEDEMKSPAFLDKLNANAAELPYDCCRWITGKDGFPTLEIVKDENYGGVDAVVIDEDEDTSVSYYSLTGIKISNPSGGIYIVRKGAKVYKQYFE